MKNRKVCLKLCLLAIALIELALAQEDKLDGYSFQCAGLEVSAEASDPPKPPGVVYPSPDPKSFRPFRVLYKIFLPDNFDDKNYDSLDAAAKSANSKFEALVEGPRLEDVRLRRRLEKDRPVCENATCGGFHVPREWVQPCYDKNGKYVSELLSVPENPSTTIQWFNNKGYSLVVYMVLSPSHPYCSGSSGPLAFAVVCEFGQNVRPTHGTVVICHPQPKNIEPELLSSIFIHETLHIMTVYLVGSHFPFMRKVGGTDKENTLINAAHGRTWFLAKRDFMRVNGTDKRVLVPVITTDNVRKFVREHFYCETLKGAELAIKAGQFTTSYPLRDPAHWSLRVYPDEVLSPTIWPQKKFSKLTLAFLKDSTWYDVHFDKADPLTMSRPSKRFGCDAARKGCLAIFDQIANDRDTSFQYIGPFCDPTRQVKTPQCSSDGQIGLTCKNFSGDTSYCHVKSVNYRSMLGLADDYNNAVCSLATRQPKGFADSGFRIGTKTLCVTVTSFAPSFALQLPFPACVEYQCVPNRAGWPQISAEPWLQLTIRPKGGQYCTVICERATSGDQKRRFTKAIINTKCTTDLEILCPNNISLSMICPSGSAHLHGPAKDSTESYFRDGISWLIYSLCLVMLFSL